MITQNWRQLAAIQIGALLCLPMLLVGYELAHLHGAGLAVSSILFGNLLLVAIALVGTIMSFHYKVTTAELGAAFFGAKGKILFTLILVATMSSWFAVQVQVMSGDLSQVLAGGNGSEWLERALRPLLAAAIVIVGLTGLKGITKVADLCIPLMLGTLACALYCAVGEGESLSRLSSLTIGFSPGGISLVMAASIAAVVDLSTFFRHAATRRDGIIAALLIFGVATPLVEVAGVSLYLLTEAPQITEALRSVPHPWWDVWILFFMLLAGWTVCNANLYSAAMNFATTLPSMSPKSSFLIAGAIAIALSCFDLLAHFAIVLDVMGVAMASMGAALLASYLCRRYCRHRQSLVGWCSGLIAGVSVMVFSRGISGSPSLDAFLVAGVVTTALLVKSYLFTVPCRSHEEQQELVFSKTLITNGLKNYE